MPPWLNKETARTVLMIVTTLATLFGVDASRDSSQKGSDVHEDVAVVAARVEQLGGEVQNLTRLVRETSASSEATDRALTRLAEIVERDRSAGSK